MPVRGIRVHNKLRSLDSKVQEHRIFSGTQSAVCKDRKEVVRNGEGER
jgi:hypothetical protein